MYAPVFSRVLRLALAARELFWPVLVNHVCHNQVLRELVMVLGEVPQNTRGCPRGVMVKALDCVIIVREFVLQLRYYIHFWANTLGKGMNPLILPAMG